MRTVSKNNEARRNGGGINKENIVFRNERTPVLLRTRLVVKEKSTRKEGGLRSESVGSVVRVKRIRTFRIRMNRSGERSKEGNGRL